MESVVTLDLTEVVLPVLELYLSTLLVQFGVPLHHYLRLPIKPTLEQVNLVDDALLDTRHHVPDGISLGRPRLILCFRGATAKRPNTSRSLQAIGI